MVLESRPARANPTSRGSIMPLSETAIRQSKAAPRPIKMFDGRDLFLLLKSSGSRYWRFKYRINGKEMLLALGVYPDVSLKLARDRREEARRLVANGIDPGAKRQAEKLSKTDTFEAIAREWLALQEHQLSPATFKKAQWTFETLLFPRLSDLPIATIKAPDLLAALRKIEARGTYETTHRAKQRCGQIFRYAIATGRAEHDITADLRGALAPVVTKNRAALTDPARVAELLRAIDSYRGAPTTAYALKLASRTFVRPGELRYAEWSEVDFDNAEWRIPSARMKMGELHVVPLARQVVGWLRELHSITGRGKFLFPSLQTKLRPISENTVNVALRRLGYSRDEMTGHGFRAMASTLLNERGWHPDVIELQLAHAERNKVRAAYNRAQRLAERRTMMQAWADYLDALASSDGVTVGSPTHSPRPGKVPTDIHANGNAA
jgi:integrase